MKIKRFFRYDERSPPMPSRLPRYCSYPGCPELTTERFCALHRKQHNRDYNQRNRSPDHNKIYGRRWHTIRDAYIAWHPLCELCEAAGKLVPADVVHHKLPVNDGGDHSDSNLQSLCNSCHGRVTDDLSRRRVGGS